MREKRASPDASNPADPNAALLHEVLDRMPQGVIMFSRAGRMLYCNRRYRDTYGFSEDDLKPGITMEGILTLRSGAGSMGPEERKYCERQLAAMRKGEVLSGFHPTPDGRTIHYINTPIPSGGWIVTHEDMTQQRQAEQRIEHMASHDALTRIRGGFGGKSRVADATIAWSFAVHPKTRATIARLVRFATDRSLRSQWLMRIRASFVATH